MSRTISYTPQGVDVRFTGVATGAEIDEVNEETYAHSYEDELRYVIFDFVDVARIDISPEAVHAIAEADKRHSALRPRFLGVLITPKPSDYGLARMWQGYAADANIESAVFKSRVEALAWLKEHGIEVPEA